MRTQATRLEAQPTQSLRGRALAGLERVRSLLARETSGAPIITQLDVIRFVAIGLVILHHTRAYYRGYGPVADDLGWVSHFAALSNGGVQLFFVISGCVLGIPFARHHLAGEATPRLGRYFLRRLTRLEPPYLINLLLWFGLLIVMKGKSAAELLPHLLASMTYTHNLVYGTMSEINAVAWSLEVEVQFYLVMPLLARLLANKTAWKRRASFVLLAAVGAYFDSMPAFRIQASLLSQIPYFSAGIILADLYVSGALEQGRRLSRTMFDLAGLFALCAMLPVFGMGGGLPTLMTAALFLLLIVASFKGGIARWFGTRPWLAAIGGTCYTAYLYHFMFISRTRPVVSQIDVGGSFGASLVVTFVLLSIMTFVLCGALFVITERPFMRREWTDRVAKRLGMK